MSLVLSHREHMYPIRHVCFVVKKSNINQIIKDWEPLYVHLNQFLTNDKHCIKNLTVIALGIVYSVCSISKNI